LPIDIGTQKIARKRSMLQTGAAAGFDLRQYD
jgi:hypothetical protein